MSFSLKPASRIHIVAIGGSIMHSLAIEAQRQGHLVSGSDDEIFQPARGKLAAAGLLPAQDGWDATHVTSDLDLVVVGMHAKADNPELARAQELGLPIVSFPELVYHLSADMQRIVVAGSHGKTTITSMIMHVLRHVGRPFNYLIGAQVEGFDNSVRLDTNAPVIVIEGDEYLTSALDQTPKFLKYHHHIGVVSGIAWDHVNVFPTLNSYVRQFDHFADATPKGGALIYNEDDPIASVICKKEREDVAPVDYTAHPYEVTTEGTVLLTPTGERIPIKVFGRHNMYNISAAKLVCDKVSIQDEEFYAAIATYTGAAKRLQILRQDEKQVAYLDFAHAPSKLRATVQALAERHGEGKVTGIFELHTFSSLSPDFIGQYQGAMDGLGKAYVFFDPAVVARKGIALSEAQVKEAFGGKVEILSSPEALKTALEGIKHDPYVAIMTSGNLAGTDLKTLFGG